MVNVTAKMKCAESLRICVVGMHRSGTSCLTGSLEQAGAYLGEVNSQAPFNKKGNKENKLLRELNEDLLNFNQGSWDRIPSDLTWNEEFSGRRDAIIAEYDVRPVWAFKDPRCLLTLPFWQEALPDLKFVGTFRHPDAVVRSLEARKVLLPSTPPLQLWIDYNRRLLELCMTNRVWLVCFDWSREIYGAALETMLGEIGLSKVRANPMFYDSKLIHSSGIEGAAEPEADSSALHVEAQALYCQLQSLAVGHRST